MNFCLKTLSMQTAALGYPSIVSFQVRVHPFLCYCIKLSYFKVRATFSMLAHKTVPLQVRATLSLLIYRTVPFQVRVTHYVLLCITATFQVHENLYVFTAVPA